MAVATMQQLVLAVLFVLCLPLLTVEKLVDQVVVEGKGMAPIVAVPHALEFGEQQMCVVDVMQLSLVVPEDAEVEYVKVLGWSAPRDVVQLPNFEAMIIPRGENGTFQVVLLPVELGNTKSILFLETSVGRVAVSVTAYTRMNVLGVTPLYDAFAQVNTLFQASVGIYNLDAEGDVQIHEIYTTEDFFHIRLDADSKWEIQPHARENVARITFQSHIHGDYRGYYRVKTNKVNLLVPVHVTVREKGLYPHPALVDLGDVAMSESGDLSFLPSDTFKWHTLSSTRQMRVSLCNFKETPIQITRVLVVSSRREVMSSSRPASAGPVIARYLRSLELPAGAVQRSAIVLELNLDLANEESLVANKRYTGHVIVHTNETNPQYAQIVIPYTFSVKRPAIVYQPEVLQLACGGLNLEQKSANVYWKNTLATPLLVSSLSIQGLAVGPQVNFTLAGISTQIEGSVIEPGATLGPFEVSLPSSSMLVPAMVEETQAIVLATNATTVAIPITFYHGRLRTRPIEKPGSSSRVFLDRNHFYARNVALGSTFDIRFELSNPSAKAVRVQKVTPVPSHPGLKMSISLVGGAELERHTIPPFQNVELVCILNVPQAAPRHLAFGVIVETDYEELKMGGSMSPVFMKVESFLRNLPPSPFSAHIGEQVQYGDLHVNFEYTQPLRIIGYASQDSRVSIVDLPETIYPGKNIPLGKVVIDFRNCQDAQDANCKYIADTCRGVGDTPVVISEHAQDANSLFDFVKQMSAVRARWPEIEEKGENHMSATIVLETSILGTNIEFTVQVDKILCPLVVNNHEVLDFGSLVMGDSQQGFVQIMNPSRSQPLRVEFMLAKNIPNIGPRLADSDTVPPVNGQVPSFSVPGDVILHALVMPPQTKTLVGPIYFSPQKHDSANGISRSMICVVNNLTSLEPIRLEGRLTRPFIGVKESSIVNFDKFYHGSAVLRYQQVESYPFSLEPSDISWRQEKLEMDVKVTQDDGYVLSKSFKLTIFNRGEARAIIESVELLETSSPGNFVVEPISQRVLLPVGGELELNLKFFSDCKEATPSAVLKVFHGSREFSVFVTNTEISEDVLKECREQANAYSVRRMSWYGMLVCCTLVAIAALVTFCPKHKATTLVKKMEKVPQHITTSSTKDCKVEETKKTKPKAKSRSPKLKLAKTKMKTKTSNPDVKEDSTPTQLKHKEEPKPISPEDETTREEKNEKEASPIIHQVSVTHRREKKLKADSREESQLEAPEDEKVDSELSSAQSPDTTVTSMVSEQDPMLDAFEENAPKPLPDSTVSKQKAVRDKIKQRPSPTPPIKGPSSSLSPPSSLPSSPSIAHDSSVPATPSSDDGNHSTSILGQTLNSDHAGHGSGIDLKSRSKPGRGLQNPDHAKKLRQAPKDFPRSHNTSRKQQSNWRKAKSNGHDAQTGNGISTSHGMNGSRFAKNPRNRNKTSQKDTGGQYPKSRVPAQYPLMPPPARLPVQAPHAGIQPNGGGGLHGANTPNMIAFSQPRTVDYGGHGGQLQHKGSPPPGLVTRSLFGPSLFQEPVRDALVDAVKSSPFDTQHGLRPPPPNFQQHHEQPTVGPGNDIFTASQSYFEPISQNTNTAFGLPDFSQPSDSTFLRGLVDPPIQPETRRVAPPPGLEGFPPNIYDSESTSFETRNGQHRADGYHGLSVIPPSGITTRRRSQLHDATDSPKSPGDSPFGDFGFLSNDD